MKEQHTPGPWTVSPNGSIEYKGGFIGEAYDMNVGYDSQEPQDLPMMANARLMAAAPEMLELLEAMVGFDSLAKTRAKRRAYQLIQKLKPTK